MKHYLLFLILQSFARALIISPTLFNSILKPRVLIEGIEMLKKF